VPTCRRPDLLQRCLQALQAQSLPGEWFEVIVVDDGDTPDTQALVEDFAGRARGKPAFHYLRNGGAKGPAGARNTGWRAARAPVIAFTDDDTVPDVQWLRFGLEAMRDARAAVRGRVFVPPPVEMTDHARMTKGLEDAEFVTANVLVRKEALQAVDGFDERFRRPWREDSDLHYKLIRLYGAIPKSERALVLHPVRPAPWGISLKQQANTAYDALLYKKHPATYRHKVGRVHAPPLYYAVVGLTGLALGLALAAQPWWALAGLLAALAGIGRITWQRLRHSSREPSHVLEMAVTSAAIPFLSLWWRLVGALRFRVLFF
jgi:glycosyltransferase involved in cell wall biosynthesis